LQLSSIPPEYRGKPAPLPLSILKVAWAARYARKLHEEGLSKAMNPRIMLVGDSSRADGGLACNVGIHFELVDPSAPAEAWRRAKEWALGSAATKGSCAQ
jgi:hypothetical protein